MTSRNDFQLWFAMGLLMGAIVAFQLVAVAGHSGTAEWVERYQALIGAVIAVLAAVLTAGSALLLAEMRRRERLQAARALLPFALTKISRYSQETVMRLGAILPANERDFSSESLTGEFQGTALPEDAFVDIAKVIELAELEIGGELSELLSRAQYFNARLEEVTAKSAVRIIKDITPHAVRGRIVDHLDLYARLSRCFNYARFRSETISHGPLTISEMNTAASVCGIFDDKTELHKLIDVHVRSQSNTYTGNRTL